MMNKRNDERKEDNPPYSRVFVVCSRDLKEENLREPFEKHGEVEDIYMPKDRNTGERKGVAYIKYAKTSSAAAAIQALHLSTVAGSHKPIKVMLAIYRNDQNAVDIEKLNRLFIKIARTATESEIKEHFSKFGDVDSVHIQKDKATNESKGLAYVHFRSFLEAAKAFEQCDKKYKAVFATPKQDLKRSRDSDFFNRNDIWSSNSNFSNHSFNSHRDELFNAPRDPVVPPIRTSSQHYNTICVTCCPPVSERHLASLFNIIPGMVHCHYAVDSFAGVCKAIVSYQEEKAAAHAVETLNNFEFPSGEVLTVKPDNPLTKAANDLNCIVNSFKNAVDSGSPDLAQLADAIAQASSLIKAATSGRVDVQTEGKSQFDRNYCSVPLPPVQPMANPNVKVAQRCFIVCKPQPPHINVLKDVFRRFGDLIEVATFPHKTFGFVKFGSVKAAQDAMRTLHGETVCGVTLKVMEADDKPSRDNDSNMDVEDLDKDSDRKRKRPHDED